MTTNWSFGQRAGLFDLPSRPICTLHGDEFGRDLSRKALAKAADHKLRGLQQSAGLFNADTGWMLRINKNGRSKMGDNPQLTPVESRAIACIESGCCRSGRDPACTSGRRNRKRPAGNLACA